MDWKNANHFFAFPQVFSGSFPLNGGIINQISGKRYGFFSKFSENYRFFVALPDI